MTRFVSIDQTVDHILNELGRTLNVALPLGLGKPSELVNALYQRAVGDSSLQLTFLTALSLEVPRESDPLRGKLLNPVFDRLYDGYVELDYAKALSTGDLPENISVKEFFVSPGSRLGNARAQQNVVLSNYTHAARDVVNNGCNLVLQTVAEKDGKLSLSSNPDTTPEVIRTLEKDGRPYLSVAVVNEHLPFMLGDAVVEPDYFHAVLSAPVPHSALFPMPKLMPVSDAETLIGLRASSLVKDGGTLQIGIGALGDAITDALMLRHRHSEAYVNALNIAGELPYNETLITETGGTAPFEQGLYAATEMFVEGFWHLIKAGIVKREVYDFWALQKAINRGLINPESICSSALEALESLGLRVIRGADFQQLQYHGFFRDDCHYDNGFIVSSNGERVVANVADSNARAVLARDCLGAALRNGRVLHGGFFLGSQDFYQQLRDMPEELRRKIDMASVWKINQLDHNPRLYRAQRQHARFINTGMVATLNGAMASDTLESGQQISGIGGQYNFVAMAHQLPTGRSILMVRASRESGGKAVSNIMSHYGACSIPRHLRDIVITEYGIADLRSKTDAEVYQSMIGIADSRFQESLLEEAKAAGKVPHGWQVPDHQQHNTPERAEQMVAEIRSCGDLQAYPFGCDFTAQELRLAKGLKRVAAAQAGGKTSMLKAILKSFGVRRSQQTSLDLKRLGLDHPTGLKERLVKQLLAAELQRAED